MKSKLFESAYLFIGKVFDAGIMFIFNIIAAKWIGIEGYGTYVYISAFVMLLSIGLKIGLDQGITILVPRTENDDEKASIVGAALSIMYLLVSLVVILVIIFSKPITIYVLNDANDIAYLKAYIPILFMLPLTQVSEGIFRSFYQIKHYVVAKNIIMPVGIFTSMVVGYLLNKSFGTELLFISNYVGFGIASAYILIILIRNKMINLRLKSNIMFYRQLLVLSIPLIFLGLHEYVIGRVDAYIIGYYASDGAVGVYNIAEKVAYIGTFTYVAIGSITAPEISRYHHQGNIKSLNRIYQETTKWLIIVNTLVFFEILIVADWFMDFATNGLYSGNWLLILLAFAYLIHSFFGPVAFMNSMTGSHNQEMKIALSMISLNIVLDIILFNVIGIVGIVISTIIVFLLGSIYRKFILRKISGIEFRYKNLRIVLLGVILWIPLQLINANILPMVYVILIMLLYALVYMLMIYKVILTNEDKVFISIRLKSM